MVAKHGTSSLRPPPPHWEALLKARGADSPLKARGPPPALIPENIPWTRPGIGDVSVVLPVAWLRGSSKKKELTLQSTVTPRDLAPSNGQQGHSLSQEGSHREDPAPSKVQTGLLGNQAARCKQEMSRKGAGGPRPASVLMMNNQGGCSLAEEALSIMKTL